MIVHPLFGDHGKDYSNLYIVPASGGAPRLIAKYIAGFVWSADSQSIVFSPQYRGTPWPPPPGGLPKVSVRVDPTGK